MSMANRRSALRLSGCLLGGMLLLLAAGRGLKAETRLFSFSTSKGLAVKVLQDNDLPFVHAQLLIYLDGNVQNYSSLAIAQLAVMNMFERSLNSPPSNLMDMLQRQGNDFQVEQNPEYVKNFWPLFMRGRDWKKEIAQLLAYQQLTGNFYFSQGFLLQDILNGINMAQLRSFLLRTFRPDNALLILKGKINPYFILGMIEKDLPQPPARQARPRKEDAPLNVGRKIFILNVNSPELPMVYWFDTAPPAGDPAYLPFAIGNHSLFGFPGGRIYQSERNQFMMGGYKVNSEAVFLKDFTMFCNSLRLNYNELENFLLLVEQERKRFAIRPIERKEYLDALNYYVGKAMVETSRYDHGLQAEIDRFTERGTPPPPRPGPELFQEVSFGRVQQALDEQMGSRHKSGSREKGIVVLVGNANLIVNSLRLLKTEALELSMD